jgi:GT2 family glycosyltransferase
LPSLSVVIPTARGGGDLEACLRTLAEQSYPGLDVVVVDNASAERAGERVATQFSGVRVIRNEQNLGFVGASNQGIDASGGELILLLNDDTELEPGALTDLVEALVCRPAWGACQPKLLLMDDPGRVDTAGSFLTATGFLVHRGAYEPEAAFTKSDEIFAAKGAAFLVRRRALEEVGSFDPDFFAYFEETDLCWRLWLAGWEVGFAADARVLHKLGATASGLPSALVQFHSFKNRICTLLKNLGASRLSWMLPYHLALCLGLAGWFSLRGQTRLAAAIVRAVAWNVTQLPRTLRKRRRVQQLRRVTDPALMPRITRPIAMRTLVAYARRTV